MPDDPKGIADDLKTAVTALQTLSTDMEEMKGTIDVLDTEKFTRIETSVGDLSQKISDAFVADEAREKRLKDLEAEASNWAANKGDDAKMVTSSKTRKAMADYLRFGQDLERDAIDDIADGFMAKMLTDDPDMLAGARKDLVVGRNPDGGYFVTPERSSQILTRVFETSPLRGMASVATTTASELEFVLDDDEVASAWVGEVGARGTTASAQVGMIKIPVHELFANPKATQKMLDDAGFDVEGWISGKVSRKFSRTENTAFVAGDGSQKPKGFLTYAAAADPQVYERDAIGRIVSSVDNDIAGDDFKELQGALKEDFQGPAMWGMKRATWTKVTSLKTTDNFYLFNSIDNLAKGQPLILLGKPVVLMDDMPVVADGALSVAYADWAEAYTIVDRIGIRVLRDPFTDKPNVQFYTTKRTGGAVTSYDAIKLLEIQ